MNAIKNYLKRSLIRIEKFLDHYFWYIGEVFKLYIVAVGCILDEITVRVWKQKAIHTGFPGNTATDKVAIVTGGASGIGEHICKGLCHFGVKLIIAGRNEGRALKIINAILEEIPTADVKFMHCDLSSFKSIESFATKFRETGLPLNYLINNAGVMLCPHWTTTDGFEEQLGVNYIGHVHLTNLLMDIIKSSGSPNSYSRIVNVCSEAYSVGTIDFSDFNSNHRYSAHAAYAQSKLAQLMWTLKLQRELSKTAQCYVTINAVHPGVIGTNLYRHTNILIRTFTKIFSKLLKSPHAGGYVCVYAALSKELEGLGGRYIRECREVRTTAESVDLEKQEKLWELTSKLISSAQAGKSVL